MKSKTTLWSAEALSGTPGRIYCVFVPHDEVRAVQMSEDNLIALQSLEEPSTLCTADRIAALAQVVRALDKGNK